MMATSCVVGCNLFSTFLVKDVYQAQGKSNKEADEHLSILFLVTNSLCLVISLLFGWISDRVKIYKTILLTNIGILASGFMMLYAIYSGQGKALSILFYLGFVLTMVIRCLQFMTAVNLISRITSDQTRGTMFAFNGIMASIGITVLQGCGGYFYTNVSKAAPFLYWYVGYLLVTVFNLVLVAMGKLTV